MTVDRSNPRAKPRWLALFALVVALTAVVGAGVAYAIGPSDFAVVLDEHGANDVPAQSDVTQMGRMASAQPNLRLFWSWDSTSAWTGNGQTGDACALFDDDDTDGFIDYVVCARVQNLNANPNFVQILPAATDKPVYIFDCSNKKFDRCTNPAPRAYNVGQVTAGPFGSLSTSGAGNLINGSDPFGPLVPMGPGESYPNDSSIDILIASALVPTGVTQVNLCSYPSAGNGGNNNPFDCIRTPGNGTLIVNKTLTNDNGGTAAVTSFNFTVGSGTATTGVVGSTAFEADASNSISLPPGTYSVAEVGTPIAGYTTTYNNCTSVTVPSAGEATCTITNNDQAATLHVVKVVTNDNGGTKGFTDFSFSVNGATAVTFEADGTNDVSVSAGSYTVTEPAVAGYSTTYDNCSNVVIANGGEATCTITNNDDIATPGITTTLRWILHDSMSLTGFKSGGTASTATFTLYRDSGAMTSCEPATQIYQEANVAVNDLNGQAATATGFSTTVAGTYRWVVTFNGNNFNAGISSDCDDEVTILP